MPKLKKKANWSCTDGNTIIIKKLHSKEYASNASFFA